VGNNLHISYDLNAPGQSYETVIAKIKTLGNWAKIHKSYWYVNSVLTAEQACGAVWSVMDGSDTVYVADTTNNSAAWQNIDPEAEAYIKDQWLK
jgi:hypothetical protein